MIRQRMSQALPIILALFFFVAPSLVFAFDVPRMSSEDLRDKLGQEGLVVVDVRTGRDWKSSEFKIKGAVRAETTEIVKWASAYGKDTTLVLYCA